MICRCAPFGHDLTKERTLIFNDVKTSFRKKLMFGVSLIICSENAFNCDVLISFSKVMFPSGE